MSPKRILVSGCSYVEGAMWPQMAFPNTEIVNIGQHGAGNQYISNSIIHAVDPKSPPDYVFVLFAGVNRADVALPKTKSSLELLAKKKFGAVLDDTVYLFSGGSKINANMVRCYNEIRDAGWPDINGVEDWLNLDTRLRQECLDHDFFEFDCWSSEQLVEGAWALSYFNNATFLETQTYKAVGNCVNFLESHNIKYNFGFVYDPFNTDYQKFYGCLNKKNPMYSKVNWNKFINLFPYEIGLKYDLFAEDGAHLSESGQELFAKQLQKKIT